MKKYSYLLQQLSKIGKVEIETNGKNLYSNVLKLYEKVKMSNIYLTIDFKLNQSDKEYFENGLKFINAQMLQNEATNGFQPHCCIKIVVKNKHDIDVANNFALQHSNLQVIVSPCYEIISPTEIADYMVMKNYRTLRMQIQLHKYLWESDARGR